MSDAEHWDETYAVKGAAAVSWFAPRLTQSLALLERCAGREHLVDVGGGASTLVDEALRFGFGEVTVLDLSARALDISRQRLESLRPTADLPVDWRARVHWRVGDVTRIDLPRAGYDLWHDRAVLHFLTDAADQERYVSQLRAALRPGGAVVISAFALDGPSRCSGLPVQRYDADSLGRLLGQDFVLEEAVPTEHRTPGGATQAFVNVRLTWAA